MDPFEQATETIAHPPPATPGGDVVVESDKIEGGVYRGVTPAIGPWKCPACAAENVGPLQGGCASCGSGSAQPRHVGLPPVVRPKPGAVPQGRIGVGVWENDQRQAARIEPPLVYTEPILALPAADAFDEWFASQFREEKAAALKTVLAKAWHAAIQWYVAQRPTVVGTEPPTAAVDVDNVQLPRALVLKVIEILEGQTEQSEEDVLMVIAQLRESIEHE